jgi:hypothetical protein
MRRENVARTRRGSAGGAIGRCSRPAAAAAAGGVAEEKGIREVGASVSPISTPQRACGRNEMLDVPKYSQYEGKKNGWSIVHPEDGYDMWAGN